MRFYRVLLVLPLALAACRVPPEDELESAQKQIEAARRSEAGRYAPELMRDAEQLLGDASLKVSEKSYDDARALADQAKSKAAAAEKAAHENLEALRQHGAAFQSGMERQLADLKSRIEMLPKIRDSVRTRLEAGLQEVRDLMQQYADRMKGERFAEIQDLEPAAQQRLQQLLSEISDIENGVAAKPKKEAAKKAP